MKVTSKNPIKGIRLRTINIGMISISCILYILLIWATIHAWQKYEHLVSSTDEYIQCEKNAALVADGSNYLTEQVRLYTVTLDEQYVQNYFTEVYETAEGIPYWNIWNLMKPAKRPPVFCCQRLNIQIN